MRFNASSKEKLIMLKMKESKRRKIQIHNQRALIKKKTEKGINILHITRGRRDGVNCTD